MDLQRVVAELDGIERKMLEYLAEKQCSVWLDGEDAIAARALAGMGLAQGYDMPDGGFTAAISKVGRQAAADVGW